MEYMFVHLRVLDPFFVIALKIRQMLINVATLEVIVVPYT
jgi:hypothetical protein